MVDARRAVAQLFVAAVLGGAVAGLVSACFIWTVERGIEAVWVDLPEWLDVAPFDSWWLVAVPVAGGILVGLGQRYVGDLPMPITEVVRRFRRGDGVDPALVPGAFAIAVAALVAGGALGFEAALSCIVGGLATGIARRLGSGGEQVRAAWGLGASSPIPDRLRTVAGWVAALSGVFTFVWLPFGEIDLGFRLDEAAAARDPANGLLLVLYGLVAAVPLAWSFAVVVRAEHAALHRRRPVVMGALGGLVLAALGSVDALVLFSGQEGIATLGELSTGTLIYVAAAKWAALAALMLAGWRGGPIFPLWLSAAAVAVLVLEPLGVPAELAIVGGIAAVSTVFLRGRILPAVVLSLYAVPASYAGAMLLTSAGAAMAVLVAGEVGWLPDRSPGRDGETAA